MTRRFAMLIVMVIAIGLNGCGSRTSEPQPPTIHYGQDTSEMGMIISDPRFAAAIIPTQGDPILFDDIGELCRFRQIHQQPVLAQFVHDFHDTRWLRAEQSWYLLSPQVRSPMGWGLAAFGDEATALQAQAERGGTVLTWGDLRRRDWSRPPIPDQ